MIVHFSEKPLEAIRGIVTYNYRAILWFIFFATLVYLVDRFTQVDITLPVIPVSILGGGLAIFLAFRNISAYDRWWEARKI